MRVEASLDATCASEVVGEPIERIQLLCGHADKTTTESRIKVRWTETAPPNLSNIQ